MNTPKKVYDAYGFIKSFNCSTCNTELEEQPRLISVATFKCPNCHEFFVLPKSNARKDLEEKLKVIVEPSQDWVDAQEYEYALTVTKYFKCKRGWNPRNCDGRSCGTEDYYQCMDYCAAVNLVESIHEGKVLVCNLEKAWTL